MGRAIVLNCLVFRGTARERPTRRWSVPRGREAANLVGGSSLLFPHRVAVQDSSAECAHANPAVMPGVALARDYSAKLNNAIAFLHLDRRRRERSMNRVRPGIVLRLVGPAVSTSRR